MYIIIKSLEQEFTCYLWAGPINLQVPQIGWSGDHGVFPVLNVTLYILCVVLVINDYDVQNGTALVASSCLPAVLGNSLCC